MLDVHGDGAEHAGDGAGGGVVYRVYIGRVVHWWVYRAQAVLPGTLLVPSSPTTRVSGVLSVQEGQSWAQLRSTAWVGRPDGQLCPKTVTVLREESPCDEAGGMTESGNNWIAEGQERL